MSTEKTEVKEEKEGNMDFVLWQLLDSSFPAGSFSHSAGLEMVTKTGFFQPEELTKIILFCVEQAASSSLPLIYHGHAAATSAQNGTINVERWKELDAFAQCNLSNHVANRASTSQGRGLLSAVREAFPNCPGVDQMKSFYRLNHHTLHCHHAPVFGMVMGAMGMTIQTTQRAYLHMATRSTFSAAVRMGLLGPNAAQRIMAQTWQGVADILGEWGGSRDLEDCCTSTPMLDILQACHDRQASRLFNS